jgi:uncharacterized protein (DUF2235 family)
MKRLVLCCDGTWNKPDEEEHGIPVPTNVVRLAYRVAKLAKSDGTMPQITYYDLGVGTGNVVDRITGGVLGDGLEDNIYDAYRFLVGNYEPRDEIFLFGFSRGAFTARSIGGMIRKCGILRRGAVDKYHEAKTLYHSDVHPDDPQAVAFRKANSLSSEEPIKIKFIGVWDTVGSLGIPKEGGVAKKLQFHDTELSGTVENGYHALAIDEHRAPFLPTLWNYKPKPPQKVEQVWFCGAHSDVGGGYLEDDASKLALLWMLDKAQGAGLKLDEEALKAFPIVPNARGKLHNSKGLLYTFSKSVDRVIGCVKDTSQPDPTQSVHESVRQRWDADSTYRPAQLREYFKRAKDPRGERP